MARAICNGSRSGGANQAMNPGAMPDKARLRRELRSAIKRLSAAQIGEGSLSAQARLRQQTIWRQARSILFYAPIAGEIDLWPLAEEALRSGKTVALPRFIKETMGTGLLRR